MRPSWPRGRPSFYLCGTSLLLLVSALLALTDGATPAISGEVERLRARGWGSGPRLSCTGAEPGRYFELENDETAVEALALPDGSLAARLPLPEAPYRCRSIPQPLFVEEL